MLVAQRGHAVGQAATASFMADPFIEEGIFASVEVKPWRVAFNHTGKEF